ncbi:thioesterase II family protein [Chryseobacterium cucumeris]
MDKNTKFQLFLLHFAGGSIYSYDFLKKYIEPNIEFIPLELPGRGKRFSEKLLKTKNEVIDDYFSQIKKLRNNAPYIIFGHSMGATIGLSLVTKLEAIGDAPEKLIVSGNPGPGIKKENDEVRYLLNDLQFKETLGKLGGIPKEVLDNQELYEYFAPIIRADFECLEKYFFSEKGIQINIPIFAMMGDEEELSTKIENWSNFTNKDFEFKILQGNHFFIHDHPFELGNIIMNCCYTSVIR